MNIQSYSRTIVYLILYYTTILTGSLYAQTVKTDSTRFPIGSSQSVTIEHELLPGQSVKWPIFHDTITKSIEILSKSNLDTIQTDGGKKVLRQVLNITSFDTGFIVLPPLIFQVTDASGQNQQTSTQPTLFQVYKFKVDESADIKDIKSVLKAPVSFREILPWIIGIIVLLIASWLIYRYIKRRPVKTVEDPVRVQKLPAWDLALQKLDTLKAEQLWQKGEIKEYYTRLTDILREYFEMKYNVAAAEMTSSEIMMAMNKHINDIQVLNSMQTVLFLADMAKFAKAKPGINDNEQSILYAYSIVNLTKKPISEIEAKKEDI